MLNRWLGVSCFISISGKSVLRPMAGIASAHWIFDKVGKYAKSYMAHEEARCAAGKPDRASANYTKVPQSSGAYKFRGIAYLAQDWYDQGGSDFNKAIQLASQCFEAYCNHEVAYSVNGEHNFAIADLSKAIGLNSQPSAYKTLPLRTEQWVNEKYNKYAKPSLMARFMGSVCSDRRPYERYLNEYRRLLEAVKYEVCTGQLDPDIGEERLKSCRRMWSD